MLMTRWTVLLSAAVQLHAQAACQDQGSHCLPEVIRDQLSRHPQTHSPVSLSVLNLHLPRLFIPQTFHVQPMTINHV